jgi:radical SAM protein with 4Fe4S-binding SPASM domain
MIRAKTFDLKLTRPLEPLQVFNSLLNEEESRQGALRLESLPRRVIFELTNACNMHCIMCGRNSGKFTPVYMNPATIGNLGSVLEKCEETTLFGWGEPTLHPDFQGILETLDSYPARKYLLTNGMRLAELAPILMDHSLDLLGVSLDGANPGTNDRIRAGGSFDRVLEGIRHMVSLKRKSPSAFPHINLVMTLMKSNLEELPDMVRLARSLGIEEVKGVYLTAFSRELAPETLWDVPDRVKRVFEEADRLAGKLDILLKLPQVPGEDDAGDSRHRHCYVGWRDLFVGADGNVRPCMSTPQLFGQIRDAAFEDLWNGPAFQDFREKVNKAGAMPVSCERCYQSSHANWNLRHSFVQVSDNFYPEWQPCKP